LPVAAKATEPAAVEPKKAPAEAVTEETPAVDEAVEAKPVKAKAEKATAKKKATKVEDEAPAEAVETKTETKEAAEEAPAVVEAPAEPAVEAAAEAPAEPAATAKEVEDKSDAEKEAPVEAKDTAADSDADADAAPEATEAAAEASAEKAPEKETSKLASGLPRAGGSPGKGLPRLGGPKANTGKAFPGLGSAVVRPPPGYDPTNPEASRAAPAAPAAKKDAKEKQWRDEQNKGRPGRGHSSDTEIEEKRKASGRARRGGKDRRTRVEMYMDDIASATRRRRKSRRSSGPKKSSPLAKAIKRRVEVDGSITVSNLAHGMSVKTGQVIKSLIAMGQMATSNDELDIETATLVAEEFKFEIVNTTFSEEEHMIQVETEAGDENAVTRPPVVTIMGHVDHGKTTLLDTIRKANVADGEAGGITQHTAAYQVSHEGQLITFIDTPGHAAFTEMRSRGAQVTDIVILVVAADDGIMPQTVEAINHSKAAGVQILVAVNKCDKPGVDPSTVRQALMEHELVPEEYGGDTIMCNVSALKGDGLDDLLANILLLAEVAEYKANPERHGEGSVLESRIETGRGPIATVIVQKGTIRKGDSVAMGSVWGRIRAMADCNGKPVQEAGPSMPVEITGLQDVPTAGDTFAIVEDDKAARALAEHRADIIRRSAHIAPKSVSLEELLAQANEGEKVQLNLIVKADVNGTLEAIKSSFDKIDVDGATVKILHSAVGGVSVSDVTLAQTYGAVIIGFNVRPDSKARHTADQYAVQVRTYNVIYEAIEDVEAAMKGLLAPKIEEIVKGTAEIRQTIPIPKVGTVAGVMVMEGSIARAHQVRLLREGVILWTGKLASLRRFKDNVREVEKGYECGMNLDGFNDIKVGDVLETFVEEEIKAI
jgi:translation initiation factor IF-2